MSRVRNRLDEEMLPYAQTEKGFVGIDNGPVRDNINIHLTAITARPYATPYHALEMVRKVLAPFHIGLPNTNFLSGDSGHEIFEINQFGERIGMRNNGDVVTTTGSSYFVYFEYALNLRGSFDIFCEIVNQEELDEIMDDVEDELEDGDDNYYSDEQDGSDSFETYKAGAYMKEESNPDRNWKYVKLGLSAIQKSKEYADKGNLKSAGRKLSQAKRIRKKTTDTDNSD